MKRSDTVTIEFRDAAAHVKGALTLATAGDALKVTAAAFHGSDGNPLIFDLGGVTESDSAALAVLLEWMRRAASQGRTLTYSNVPERLKQLARISDLETVLGIGDAA